MGSSSKATRRAKSRGSARKGEAISEKAMVEICERERHRIGLDLHDGICQQLTGIRFRVGLLRERLAARGELESTEAELIERLLAEAIEQTRSLAHGLAPVQLEKGGLGMALRELAVALSGLFRVNCRCDGSMDVRITDPDRRLHLYRIAQEAAHNAIRHAAPTRVVIEFAETRRQVVLRVSDDGRGLASPTPRSRSHGIQMMRYRASLLGGTLTIRRRPRGGTVVTCRIPRDRALLAHSPAAYEHARSSHASSRTPSSLPG